MPKPQRGARHVRRRGWRLWRPAGFSILDVHAIPARGNEPEHLHHDLRYLLFADGLPLSPDAELTTRWFSWDEILALSPDAGMRRMVEKAQARGLLR